MGGTYSTYGGEESCIQGFGGETYDKEPLATPKHRQRIILVWIFRKWDLEGKDWFDLA
jgi:hypothetical protein